MAGYHFGMTPRDPAARWWSKVDRRGDDECWPWKKACFEKGYGAFRLGPKQVKAHRFGYELLVGPLGPGENVLHHCDNPPCCNPAHLFIGSHRDNAHDRERKGRGRYRTVGPLAPKPKLSRARGERHGMAKMDAEKVRKIRRLRADGLSQSRIATIVGISQENVSSVLRGRTWRHVE